MSSKALLGFAALTVTLLVPGMAIANTGTVTNDAAMNGSTFGYEVFHDNSSTAYVEDDTPTDEEIYRGSFLFQVADMTATGNFRQLIADVKGDNPARPTCPGTQNISSMRLWLYSSNGSGGFLRVQGWARGNACGNRATPKFNINAGQEYRVCWESTIGENGVSDSGNLCIAVTDPASACPTSGEAGWGCLLAGGITNHLTDHDMVRMGTPANNNNGAAESGTLYFDEFESFRTLTP